MQPRSFFSAPFPQLKSSLWVHRYSKTENRISKTSNRCLHRVCAYSADFVPVHFPTLRVLYNIIFRKRSNFFSCLQLNLHNNHLSARHPLELYRDAPSSYTASQLSSPLEKTGGNVLTNEVAEQFTMQIQTGVCEFLSSYRLISWERHFGEMMSWHLLLISFAGFPSLLLRRLIYFFQCSYNESLTRKTKSKGPLKRT